MLFHERQRVLVSWGDVSYAARVIEIRTEIGRRGEREQSYLLLKYEIDGQINLLATAASATIKKMLFTCKERGGTKPRGKGEGALEGSAGQDGRRWPRGSA